MLTSSLSRSPQAAFCSHHHGQEIHPEWGAKGHGLIQEVAVENLPQDVVPDFFTDSKERLVGLAGQPDRWKPHQLSYLRGATSVDHFLAYEQIQGLELPADRYDFIAQVQSEGRNVPGAAPKYVGFLPYRVAEMYQNLTLDFAIWRNEGQNLDPSDPRRQALEENVLTSAGLLGHYVEDAAQPMHATVHHDGWNTVAAGGNPQGFRTQRGLHQEYEIDLVNAHVQEEEIQRRVGEPKKFDGDPLQWGLGLVAESNTQVEKLYTLEKNGELKVDNPSQRALEFMHDRMAVGAQNLRDLWYTAWLESENLAKGLYKPR